MLNIYFLVELQLDTSIQVIRCYWWCLLISNALEEDLVVWAAETVCIYNEQQNVIWPYPWIHDSLKLCICHASLWIVWIRAASCALWIYKGTIIAATLNVSFDTYQPNTPRSACVCSCWVQSLTACEVVLRHCGVLLVCCAADLSHRLCFESVDIQYLQTSRENCILKINTVTNNFL